MMTVSFGITLDIPLHTLAYHQEEHEGYDRLFIEGVSVQPLESGMPEIPATTYTYLIDRNKVVTGITTEESVWQELYGEFILYPKQQDFAIGEERFFTKPDPVVYSSSERIPIEPVLSFDCGVIRGYRILQITVAPFSYIPATGQLFVLRRLKVHVQTRTADIPMAPIRESDFSHNAFTSFIAQAIVNDGDLTNSRYCPQTEVTKVDGDSLPTDLPSLIGPPVDLVIITDNVQKNAYEQYIPVKKKLGINTVVKTISWIRQNYHGVDDPERIRKFLKDAMVQWGTSFAILGGDHDYVPTRMVWVDRSVIYTQLWLPFGSDLYYSDLDGTWNFDGDEKFGEVSDSLDLYSDIFVGRIPSRNASDVQAYLEKVRTYIFPSNTTFQENALFFSSNLESNWPGLPYAYEMSEHIPPYFTRSFIDETLGNLDLVALRDSLNRGFGLVAGVGHGDVNIMCIRFAAPRVYINNYFYDELHNNPCNGLLLVVTCYTNPFPANCLGEHWVRNPDGGGIAYIGPTSSSEGSIHKEYMKCLLDSAFCTLLGKALTYGKINYIGNAQWNNWHRVHQLSITLLGDPTISVWGRRPIDLTPVVVTPETLRVGNDTLFITYDPHVKPKPVQAVFYKQNDTYTVDSSATNSFVTPIKASSAGYLTYTLMVDDHIPFRDSVYVASAGPFCTYSSNAVIDTAHNSNGIINPGETIWLQVQVTNTGGSTATGVTGILACSDTFVTMITDTASFPNVIPGGTATNMSPFMFSISDRLPDDHSLNFDLMLDYSGTSTQDTFQIISRASDLEYFATTYSVSVHGDTIEMTSLVVNYGHASANGVNALLRSLNDTVIVLDSVVSFGVISPNEVVSSEPDRFVVVRQSPNCRVEVEVRVYENGSEQDIQPIVYATVPSVDSLRIFSGKSTIRLKWHELPMVRGYRIYRSLQYNGPYSLINNRLEPISHFEDFSVQPDIPYYYYVQAVDSSMNHGNGNDTLCMQINPAYSAGWPQDVYGYQYGSPNFGDIDPFYPGLEVITSGLDGCIYAWHCDGTPVNGTDPRLFNAGSNYIWASPAIGDVDRDGSLEIIFGVMRSIDNLYAIRYNPLDSNTTVLPGWPKSCQGGGFASSPVLADLNGDNDLEIIALSSFSAHLYVFNHDGSAVFHAKSGLLKKLYGNILGTPAVGDLNGDGFPEIVCAGGHQSDSVFVWDHTGQYMDPFPISAVLGQGNSMIIGDIHGNSDLEICFYAGGPSYCLSVMDIDGMISWQYPALADYIELSPACGDITGDGRPEVILCFNDGLDAGIMVFDSTGNLLPGFPIRGHNAYPPALADADNNGVSDILCGSTEWDMYAYTGSGTMVPGFPIKLGNRLEPTPAVYDIDLDGALELMVGGSDLAFHVFDLDATDYEWPRFHYDPYNSGCYRSGFYGIDESSGLMTDLKTGFKVFPSPFIDRCMIQWQGQEHTVGSEVQVTVYDISGRLVHTQKYIRTEMMQTIIWSGIDTRGRSAPCGIYFIQIQDVEHTSIHKVIKIK